MKRLQYLAYNLEGEMVGVVSYRRVPNRDNECPQGQGSLIPLMMPARGPQKDHPTGRLQDKAHCIGNKHQHWETN